MPNSRKNAPGVIVLGGNFVGLGLVRNFGRRGVTAWVYDSDASKCIAQYSRFTQRFVSSNDDMYDVLMTDGRHHHLEGWMLFPVTDEYVELLSTRHESLSTIYRVTTPPLDVTRFALDKRLTYRRAAELGIATPDTTVVSAETELDPAAFRYPLILKPAVNHHFFPHTNVKALLVEHPADLGRRFAQVTRYIPAGEVLIQECIPGDGEDQFSCCAICRDGRAYATLVARRRRQYPIKFGNASTFVETTTQPIVEADGRRFLESIGFDGIAEVEFKFDRRDSRYKILDVNPRPWGWHALGKAAGIDFPYLLWQQKLGLDTPPIETQRPASWCREITDLVAIAKAADRATELKRLFEAIWHRRLTAATFSFSDPAPFFAELALWTSAGLNRQKKAKDFLTLDPIGSQP